VDNSIIVNRLKEALALRNMNMSELARKTGMDKSLISRYLHNKVTPKIDAINRMAEVLNVSAVWLSGYDIPAEETTTTELPKCSGIEHALKELIIQHIGSVNKFSNLCGIPCSTISTMFERGIENTSMNTMISICRTLNISIDGLVAGKIVPVRDFSDTDIDVTLLTKTELAKLSGYYHCLLDTRRTD
jgi:transcriptional regulator with XRE-family HTH domain